MNEWVELNLPYATNEYFDTKELKYPNLDKRAKKELGFTSLDLNKLQDQIPSCIDDASGRYDIMNEIIVGVEAEISKDHKQYTDEWKLAKTAKLLISENEDVLAMAIYRDKRSELPSAQG